MKSLMFGHLNGEDEYLNFELGELSLLIPKSLLHTNQDFPVAVKEWNLNAKFTLLLLTIYLCIPTVSYG